MNRVSHITRAHRKSIAILLAGVMAIALVGFSGPAVAKQSALPSGGITCPAGQCFTDVPASNPFFTYINNLYIDGVISGYPCGGAGEPCDSANRPYYRASANVTRSQMGKFVDLGRRNIADATGDSLALATEASGFLASALVTQCMNAGCTSIIGVVPSGGTAALFSGGSGIIALGSDTNGDGIDSSASGATAYGGYFTSDQYRSTYSGKVDGFVAHQVDLSPNGASFIGLRVEGTTSIGGNLIVAGSKTGYVVDIMQNVDSSPLQSGDVVVIAGTSSPVLGDIPVVTVKKATQAYDTRVVGVVDQVMYVPSSTTKAAYEAEQQAIREARARRAEAQAALVQAATSGQGGDAKPAEVQVPPQIITDDQGNLHADPGATSVAVNGYANVVTLGSYKVIKVDASFGAIKAGDLLTTSSNPGYAMKVTDHAAANGAIIGKALGELNSGTGTIPVMVTVK